MASVSKDVEGEIRASRREMLDAELRHAAELGRLYEEELGRVGISGHEGRLQQRETALLDWIRRVRELMPDWPITAADVESHSRTKVLRQRATELAAQPKRARRRKPGP